MRAAFFNGENFSPHRKRSGLRFGAILWLLAGALAGLWGGFPAQAAIPTKTTYQGYLKQSGVPVSGSVPITIRLYDAPAAGTLKMTCAAGGITVSNGRFFFEIGETAGPYNCSVALNDPSIDLTQDLYIELEVNGTTLSPREQLLPAATALAAQAGSVKFTPVGGLAATDVQAALAELDNEKLNLTGGTISGGLTVSATITASAFVGDGSGLTNIPADPNKVNKAGDTITGQLLVNSSLSVSQDLSASGTIQAANFIGDGSQLININDMAAVKKAGDIMTGQLSIGVNLAGQPGLQVNQEGNGPALMANASGVGPLLQLQQGGVNTFVVNNNGDLAKVGAISASGPLTASAGVFAGTLTVSTSLPKGLAVDHAGGDSGIVVTSTGNNGVYAETTSIGATALHGVNVGDNGSGVFGVSSGANGGYGVQAYGAGGAAAALFGTIDNTTGSSGYLQTINSANTAPTLAVDSAGASWVISASTSGTGGGLNLTVDNGINTEPLIQGEVVAGFGPLLRLVSGGADRFVVYNGGGVSASSNLSVSGDISANYVHGNFFVGDGSLLTNVATDPNKVNKAGDVMTGQLSVGVLLGPALVLNQEGNDPLLLGNSTGTAPLVQLQQGGIDQFAVSNVGGVSASGGLSVSGDLSTPGSVTAGFFYGDGSGLSNVAPDPNKVNKGGDIMMGQLSVGVNLATVGLQVNQEGGGGLIEANTSGSGELLRLRQGGGDRFVVSNVGGVSVSANLSASGDIQAAYFIGDGSQLTNLPPAAPDPNKVSKAGDTMTGALTVSANVNEAALLVDQSGLGHVAQFMASGSSRMILDNIGNLNLSASLNMNGGGVTTNYLNTTSYLSASASSGAWPAIFVNQNGPGDSARIIASSTGKALKVESLNGGSSADLIFGDHAGTGNLLVLKQAGSDRFIVNNAGNLSVSTNTSSGSGAGIKVEQWGSDNAISASAQTGRAIFAEGFNDPVIEVSAWNNAAGLLINKGGVTGYALSVNTDNSATESAVYVYNVGSGEAAYLENWGAGALLKGIQQGNGQNLSMAVNSAANANPVFDAYTKGTGDLLVLSKENGANRFKVGNTGALSISTGVAADVPILVNQINNQSADLIKLQVNSTDRFTVSAVGGISASGNLSASGDVQAAYFIGDGSQLTNLPPGAPDPNKVNKAGDTMTGALTVSANVNEAALLVEQSGLGHVAQFGVAGSPRMILDSIGNLSLSGSINAASSGVTASNLTTTSFLSASASSGAWPAIFVNQNGPGDSARIIASSTGKALKVESLNGGSSADLIFGDHAGTGNLLVLKQAGGDRLVVNNIGGVSVSAGLSVSGDLSTPGKVTAGFYFGDGSQLANLPSDPNKVDKAGGIMTGQLSIGVNLGGQPGLQVNQEGNGPVFKGNSTGVGPLLQLQQGGTNRFVVSDVGGVSVSANLSASGDVQAAFFIGDGSQLTNLPPSAPDPNKVSKAGDTMTGALTVSANVNEAALLVEQSGLGHVAQFGVAGSPRMILDSIGNLSLSGSINAASSGVTASNLTTTSFLSASASSGAWPAIFVNQNGPGDSARVIASSTGKALKVESLNGGSSADLIYGDHAGTGKLLVLKQATTDKFVVSNVGGVSVSANLSASGDVQAAFFIGDGSQLANLPPDPNKVDKVGGDMTGQLSIGVNLPASPGLQVNQEGNGAIIEANTSGTGALLALKRNGTELLSVGNAGQLSIGVSLAGPVIKVNQVGAGDIIQLKNGITDRLVVSNAGQLSMSPNTAGAVAGVVVNQASTGGLLKLQTGGADRWAVDNDGGLTISATSNTTLPLAIARNGSGPTPLLYVSGGGNEKLALADMGTLTVSPNASAGGLVLSASGAYTGNYLTFKKGAGTVVQVNSNGDFTSVGAISSSGAITASQFVAALGGVKLRPSGQGSTPLDWYEEGSYTPTYKGATTGGACTYNNQTGQYRRIGKMIFVDIHIDTVSCAGGIAGRAQVTLPVNASNTGGYRHSCTVGYFGNHGYPVGESVGAQLMNGTNTVDFYSFPSGGGVPSNVAVDTNGFVLDISCAYQVD